jgi:hypothetical protein
MWILMTKMYQKLEGQIYYRCENLSFVYFLVVLYVIAIAIVSNNAIPYSFISRHDNVVWLNFSYTHSNWFFFFTKIVTHYAKNEKEFSSYHLNELISIRDYEKIKFSKNFLSTNSIIFKENFQSIGKRSLLIFKCLYHIHILWLKFCRVKNFMNFSEWIERNNHKKFVT